MLKQLARLERTRKYTILGFAVLMAVSLIIFYAPGRTARYVEPAKSAEVVAKVGKDEITVSEVALEKQNLQSRFGVQLSLAQVGFTNRRILEGIIQERVMAQEASRLGLLPSEAEVANEIRQRFKDPATGQYVNLDPDKDPARYREIATSNAGGVERFEQQFRNQLTLRNLKAFVTASVRVSDDEVQDDYKRKNTTFALSYVVVSADKLAEKIQPSDEELRSYYEQHKTDYRYLEPQRKIRYLYIDSEKLGEKLAISDKDLREQYENLSPEHKQAGVKVQQIFLRVARKDLDDQVEQKAKDLVTKVRAGDPGSAEQVFSDLAKGNSEDPVTAKNGGFLTRPVRKNPNKVDALYDRAVDMQPGEVTDPIRYAGNWYILRRGDSVPKTFDEAKPELLVSARNSRAFAVAQKLAVRAANRLKETKDAQKVAQELAAEANMRPADMIKETAYIKPGDDIPNIGNNQQFHDAIQALNNPTDVGAPTGVKGGFAIPLLLEKKDPRIPAFEEVKTKVVEALKEQRAKGQLEQKAREIAAGATMAGQVKAAGEKAGLEVATEENYKLGSVLGKAGTSPGLDEAIYSLKSGEVTRTALKVGDNWVVVGVTKRNEADLADFAKQRDQLTESMVSQRQNQMFGDFIAAVQDRMKREGKIKIYDDVLASFEEEEPVALPPRGNLQFPTK